MNALMLMEEIMRKIFQIFTAFLVISIFPVFSAQWAIASPEEAPQLKDWTFLVYLNGDNTLDSFGPLDINEMEKVGSTDQINVVVQWASKSAQKTKRLLIQKDNDTTNITSPVIQDMGQVDMGDWHSLVDFINWGAKNYPAKHYFVDIWDHGNGWHIQSHRLSPLDLSWDDNTGHYITTQQLGSALTAASQAIGQKIDLYGSDACLMAMVEVATEVAPVVNTFVGSEEVEPVDGWPYDALLSRWNATPDAQATDVAKILTEEYVKSYQGGSQGNEEVTFSALDLSKLSDLNAAVGKLASAIMGLSAADQQKIFSAGKAAQYFTNDDYVDLQDFINHVTSVGIAPLDETLLKEVSQDVSALVIDRQSTAQYQNAMGVSIWLPSTMDEFTQYSPAYNALRFDSDTHWANALQALLKETPPPDNP